MCDPKKTKGFLTGIAAQRNKDALIEAMRSVEQMTVQFQSVLDLLKKQLSAANCPFNVGDILVNMETSWRLRLVEFKPARDYGDTTWDALAVRIRIDGADGQSMAIYSGMHLRLETA